MGSEHRVDPRRELIDLPFLYKFKLYSTPTNYYLIGRDENKTFWRILKIDRTDPYELNFFEDPTIYTNEEIREVKRWLILGNQKCGGLKAETTCYGIIGFVKFLGPYYMLVIKKRKKVGEICGHSIYGIAESDMIMIPYPSDYTKVAKSTEERRYKKLLSMVDLTKNFYFSHTYHLMHSLQKNVLNSERGKIHDNTMFVWNAHLTRGIRRILQNTIWTVALVYGFFQQTKCSMYGEEFLLTVIARRSRHYAGTRYLRRGVNDLGRVANDVETEQIVSREVPYGQEIPIASVVQIRGSIPLYWSQETSTFRPQPDIILSNTDENYVATQHHFENLRQRYGKPIIILNLLKMGQKEHRETLLQAEFAKAIISIKKSLEKDNGLYAIHFDLSSKHSKSGAKGAFDHLCNLAKKSLALTGFFSCESPFGVGAKRVINESYYNNPLETSSPNNEELELNACKRQNGVLRTNCVDCLDRTNFAQYAHGSVALARQLQSLGFTRLIIGNNDLEKLLMETYQNMGDTLALQYGGSEAHIKMFSALRGGWNMVTKQRDLITAVVRYINNTYQDKVKQNAINLFLGHFQPQIGRPALWELDSDQHTIARMSSNLDNENMRRTIRRSFSDLAVKAGGMNLEERVLENTQSIREGLTVGTSEIISNEPSHKIDESVSLSFSSVMVDEDQMFPGSFSFSNQFYEKPECKFKFTPAEELFELGSPKSWSTDNLFSDVDDHVASLANRNSSFKIRQMIRNSNQQGVDAVPGYPNDFSWWVLHESTL